MRIQITDAEQMEGRLSEANLDLALGYCEKSEP